MGRAAQRPGAFCHASHRRSQSLHNLRTPAKAIAKGVPAWKAKSLGKPVVPMAGEIDVVSPDEIADFGGALAASGISEGHFYADTGDIPVVNLAAIKAL
jgi:hypothetical protein